MLLEKITNEELDFMECFNNSRCLIESLFSDFDNMAHFDDQKLGNLRLYQYPFISHEWMIDFNRKDLSEKENFALRKNTGDIYCLGARKYGKTKCVEELDLATAMLHCDGEHVGFSSIDAIHIRGIMDKMKEAVENHPIYKYIFKAHVRTSPTYLIRTENGCRVEGINMNLQSKNPGNQFFQKHLKRLYIEEASFESEQVYNKRKEAQSEVGCVFRVSGMTNFTKYSPVGRAFYNLDNKKKVINLPQFVNPMWDEKEKQDRIKEYGGEDAISYRVFVKGEVVEEGISEFDMDRIRPNYMEQVLIKRFEITKETYSMFKNLIVVERPINAERIFICSDIGESAGTDIIILSEVGNKYNYLYNIVIYNLTHIEQFELIKWLVEQLSANIIGIDCGDGTGRAVYRECEKIYPKENLVWYDGSMKINVDFEKDSQNKVVFEKGQPKYKQEYMSEWSVRRLKTLLYENRVNLPTDYKLDMELNSVISMQSGTRTVYACVCEAGDHLFDAFKVFSIAQWLKNDFNLTKPLNRNWGIGVIGTQRKISEE